MSEPRQITEPGETIYPPRPSWAPIFFAIGALGLLAGIYASGFMFSPYIYAIIGAIFCLVAFRAMVRGSIRAFYRLPRKQHVRGAALPVETISAPPKH
jgi:hypothetical protein